MLRWWLTEMSARKNEEKEKPKADEDGPPGSEEEEAEKNDFTDDESMKSSDQEIPQDLYEGFFEKQKQAKCGMHALNNSLGFQLCTDDDMTFALEDYIRSSNHEGLHEIRSMHAKRTGWYSSEVMAHAINTTSMRQFGNVRYVMDIKPLIVDPNIIHTSLGAIVNIDNNHWVAIRSIGGKIMLFDSKDKIPRQYSQNDYVAFINKRRAAYPIRAADNMSQSTNDSPILPFMSQSSSSDKLSVDMDTL
jgi:hypothetical protein